ncbi:MAG: DUF6285 domain-containing protein, partial [Alphaproteobacteria bacterium]
LLDAAREALVENLLPHVPEVMRAEALMVARAIEIAGREIEAGERPLRAEHRRLAALYGEDEREGLDHERLERALLRLNHVLAADIRRGAFDADDARARALLAHLVATALDRVRETNPKWLEPAAAADARSA